MVATTRSNKADHVSHQTWSSLAKHGKWKAHTITSKVLLSAIKRECPKYVKKKSASIAAEKKKQASIAGPFLSTPPQSQKKNDIASPTNTTLPFMSPLKREMFAKICLQECQNFYQEIQSEGGW
jgi:hypothetical protein